MKGKQNKKLGFLSLIFWIGLACVVPQQIYSAVCSDGVAEPPFLSYGVDPNVLLMIDNSGSMYDMAYVHDTDQCYDDDVTADGGSFDPASTFAGYFEQISWYEYDFATDKVFEATGDVWEAGSNVEPAGCATATYVARLDNADLTSDKIVCITIDESVTPHEVQYFAATGNFLNWATASKFDIQKKILTGGKYDSTNTQLIPESRGCMARRFVREITVKDSGGTAHKLDIGVRGPMEDYQIWLGDTDYEVGDIVQLSGTLYKANTAHTSTDDFTADSANWDEYKDSRWYPNHAYPANTEVYDTVTREWYWTASGGTSLSTATDVTGDTSISWLPYNGTSIDIFPVTATGFDVGACQDAMADLGLLDGTEAANDPKLGTLKQDTEDCMGFDPGGGNTLEAAQKSSFNHAMQECWYYNKFGHWQPGSGTVSSMKSSCEAVYMKDNGATERISPEDLTPYDSAYVCYGVYSTDADKSDYGYVGRCWEVAGVGGACTAVACPAGRSDNEIWDEGDEQYSCTGGALVKCNKNNCNNSPASKPGDWDAVEDCPPGTGNLDNEWTDDDFYYFNPCPYNSCGENNDLMTACAASASCTVDGDTWTCADTDGSFDGVMDECSIADTSDNGDRCVDQALKDFCNILDVPEVIDPSDAETSTGEVWNAPAFLVDSGIVGQIGRTIATMRGFVKVSAVPEGLVQKYANDMRIGAMQFNDNGAATECPAVPDPSDPISYDCPASGNLDGAKVISEIDKSAAHTTALVTAINDIIANAWTPLSEAFFTAIGYYTQNSDFQCQATDFTVGTDPVEYWCQNNHIVLITDGSSTADQNADMKAAINGTGTFTGAAVLLDNDANTDGTEDSTVDVDNCGDLKGSTYFDNFIYHAARADANDLYRAGSARGDVGYFELPSSDGNYEDKKNIKTHIVVSGSLRDDGDTECSPDVILPEAADNARLEDSEAPPLYVSTNYDQLEANLDQVFSDIRAGASAGSAASVISSSRGGEGAVYQAIFWPSKSSSDDPDVAVTWAGEVHALFIDSSGYLYEDSNGDRKLTSGTDKRVIIYFDDTAVISRGCYAELNSDGSCDAAYQVDLDAVKYLWSANDWLAKISHTDFVSPGYDINDQYLNRSIFVSDQRRRYIFTWNDMDNDGIVDYGEDTNKNAKVDAGEDDGDGVFESEVIPFISESPVAIAASADPAAIDLSTIADMDWTAFTVAANRRAVTNDFNLTVAGSNSEVNNIVKWLRGVEVANTRSRTVKKYMGIASDTDANGENDTVTMTEKTIVWRMGDVVHSTPTAVARPAEGLHLLYSDGSYAKFLDRWKNRRNMAYFGANDGMLHAVNAGFYNETLKKFCLTDDCASESGNPELGAEMWAYVPYNLLPHLKCLTDPNYAHKYYVDQRPRVFDAKIFTAETECTSIGTNADACVHPEGWGTVLVGAMRFGGSREEGDRLSGDLNSATDNRYFTSSYFIMDITNPEAPPVLLGEYTMLEDSPYRTDLGFTTANPTPVVMKNDTTGANEWYLLMGSGPMAEDPSDGIGSLPIFDDDDALRGFSEQKPKVAVFPLKGLTQAPLKPFRIPDTEPTALNEAGRFILNKSNNGFVSDMITVDYDLDTNYMSDAVYFGTVEHDTLTLPIDTSTQSYNDVWAGKLYRLVVRKIDSIDADGDGKTTDQIETEPYQWITLTPDDGTTGNYKPLFDADQPITAAPAVGTDGYNYWIYFGTGRFFHADDKEDNAQQSFYGVKELVDCDGNFLWTSNVSKTAVSTTLGERGLVNVSDILVTSASNYSAELICNPADWGDKSCLPTASYTTWVAGTNYVVGDIVENGGSYYRATSNSTPSSATFADDSSKWSVQSNLIITTYGGLVTHAAGSGCVDRDNDGTAETQTGKDGWYRDFPASDRPRERNVGQATLLGGLLTFTTYQPYDDLCQQEGQAYLYGLFYQTGTAWYRTVFGDLGVDGDVVKESISLGRGLATTPNLHVGTGEGPTAFVQTSTGEIIEMPQTNLPYSNFKTGRSSWQEDPE